MFSEESTQIGGWPCGFGLMMGNMKLIDSILQSQTSVDFSLVIRGNSPLYLHLCFFNDGGNRGQNVFIFLYFFNIKNMYLIS